MSNEYYGVYQIVTEMLPQFFIAIIVMGVLVGIAVRFMKNL